MKQYSPLASSISFIDLAAQRQYLGNRIDNAIARVFEHCQFIMGPEVRRLETDLGQFCGSAEVISCANGTDALGLVLMAKGVGHGDAVLCPSFTFPSTAEVVAWFGASPVFVDVHSNTFNMNAASLEAAIAGTKRLGLKPVGVIAVDLFGQPANYDEIEPVCLAQGLWLLPDAAQSFGAVYKDRKVGTIGIATTTSFFPAKPLGCYGDGGAIFTNDPELAGTLRSLRSHGQGLDKYDNVRIGMNARLDTIQAAVLIEKLKIFPEEIMKRNLVAERYNAALADLLVTPVVLNGCGSTWAQYTIRVPSAKRNAIASKLRSQGVPTAVYYHKPLHQQTAYHHYPTGSGLPVSEAMATEVLSLPMHPYLEPPMQDRIIEAVREAVTSV